MAKQWHEIRDPIHTFVRLDLTERSVVDSVPVQRLRNVHQLAMSYLVYPGATHRRFEHSLGVMELAGRVFDVVTSRDKIDPRLPDNLRDMLADPHKEDERRYWRRVLRMAALCHDIGHLPFSHAAEDELLPSGWDHHRLSKELIHSSHMSGRWQETRPPLAPLDIAKLAVGQEHIGNGIMLNDWEAILSEIVIGNAFGVDRVDYLLRDSLHAGVAYGRFDHYRLLDTLRILPQPPPDDPSSLTEDASQEPQLGVEQGGLQSAEALLLARYFMFSQVYFHPVRRIYDIHLKEYLKARFSASGLPVDLDEHLALDDSQILAWIAESARDSQAPGHDPARRIKERDHYKVLWERDDADIRQNPSAAQVIYEAVLNEFGADSAKPPDHYAPKSIDAGGFPVLMRDGQIARASALSEVLRQVPTTAFEYVFVRPDLRDMASRWLQSSKARILQDKPKEE